MPKGGAKFQKCKANSNLAIALFKAPYFGNTPHLKVLPYMQWVSNG
jgi:hypothetical protein